MLALALGAAPMAAAKPPIWIVRSKTATLVLFGSIHLLPAGLDWRPAALDDALARADEVWFELPIDAATDNRAANAAIARGALPRGRSLFAMLGPDEAARLTREGGALNCPPQALDRMQPWMADLTLSVASDARAGASAFDGVEDQIQAVTPAATRRRAFEGPEQQIDFLAGAPVKDQIASLDWTMDEIDNDPGSYQRVVDEWMAADTAGLERDALAPLQKVSPTLFDRLLGNRNRAWAKVLTKRMRHGGQIVVVVGVGHMLGPGGLPALLRADGLDVEGP
ncbi:MAG TPA: TraB/GumN family protein [Caulobacteraceae bacterium]|jgi:hypothetical protein|nr:TraB/GumN family protein [Caulobacteraceae bacterium]